MDLRDLPMPSRSNVLAEAEDAAGSTSATLFTERPTIATPKSKAQKQREYRQRIAASRTPAEAIAARKWDAERQRICRLRKAANSALVVSGSVELTTASSSRSETMSNDIQNGTQRQLTHQQRQTSAAEPSQITVQPEMTEVAEDMGSGGEEADPPRIILSEADVREFLDGEWPVKHEDAEYAEEGLHSDSEEEGSKPKKPRAGWTEDPTAALIPGTHFLEASGTATHPDPMPFFEIVLPPPVILDIITWTNQSAEIHRLIQTKTYLYSNWSPLAEQEFRQFLGLLYMTEEIKLKKLKDYWNTSRLFNIPIFMKTMTEKRFLAILNALTFNVLVPPSPANVVKNDRLLKVRPLLDHFNQLVHSVQGPGFPSVQKSLSDFKGNELFATFPWYRRVGIYMLLTLLDIGCLIYNEQNPQKKLSFENFRLKVVEGLLVEKNAKEDGSTEPKPSKPEFAGDKPHVLTYLGVNAYGKKRRKRCKYCIETKNKRKESYFCCGTCPNSPGFCIDDCFAKFHGYS